MHKHAKPVADSWGRGCWLGFCPQELQADWGSHINLSRIQTGIAQSCQEERTGHDTDHILRSHHAKYFPIAVRHNQGYARRLRKDGGSSEISSLLASTSEFWCQRHHLHQLLLLEGYDANDQPLMVVLGQFCDHIVSMHPIHIQDRSHQLSLCMPDRHKKKICSRKICNICTNIANMQKLIK